MFSRAGLYTGHPVLRKNREVKERNYMICEKCGVREANIRTIEVINGIKTEHNLCAECARTMGLDLMNGLNNLIKQQGEIGNDESLSKILSGILGIPSESQPKKQEEWDQVICPTCHRSYSEFVEKSRFGCPDCYGVFDLLMKENLKKLQASDTHVGRRPRYGRVPYPKVNPVLFGDKEEMSLEEQIKLLQAKLDAAVREEEFEDAASYRDQIRSCREKLAAGVEAEQ